MGLENLGLLLFIKYVKQIDSVKRHLMGSFREFILALNASFDILSSATAQIPFINQAGSLSTVLKRIDEVIKYAAHELEKLAPDERDETSHAKLKKEVLDSILDIIDEEIMSLSIKPTRHTQLKKEALQAIKKAFDHHYPHEDTDQNHPAQSDSPSRSPSI